MALPVVVAAGQVVALPDVVQRLGAVHLLAAGGEDPVGVDRADLGVHAHPHPAEQVDDLPEAGEVDQRGAVEPDAGEPGQGGGEQLGAGLAAAAVLVRRIDLVLAAAEAVRAAGWRPAGHAGWRPGTPRRWPAGTCTMRMVSERWSGAAVAGAPVGADQEVVERPVQVGALGAGVGSSSCSLVTVRSYRWLSVLSPTTASPASRTRARPTPSRIRGQRARRDRAVGPLRPGPPRSVPDLDVTASPQPIRETCSRQATGGDEVVAGLSADFRPAAGSLAGGDHLGVGEDELGELVLLDRPEHLHRLVAQRLACRCRCR